MGTGRVYQRLCKCGAIFSTTRVIVRWCSNKCRKQHYKNQRAVTHGDWRAIRKKKNGTIGEHTKWEWKLKLEASNFTCFWCGDIKKRRELEKDHLTPISRGGSDRIINIVPACKPCNTQKGARTAEEYAAFLWRNGR